MSYNPNIRGDIGGIVGSTRGTTTNNSGLTIVKATPVRIDGNGNISLHYPKVITDSPILYQGKYIPLEEAFELDSAPNFERFFFVVHTPKL